jgi:hypothetical protein
MTTSLIKLPGSKWWVELDDTTSEIVATYNKAAIVADIAAIRDTLAKYPDPDQEASDYADVLAQLVGKWTPAKNARILAMLGRMRDAYGMSPQSVDIAQLRARLDGLIALRDRLV